MHDVKREKGLSKKAKHNIFVLETSSVATGDSAKSRYGDLEALHECWNFEVGVAKTRLPLTCHYQYWGAKSSHGI